MKLDHKQVRELGLPHFHVTYGTTSLDDGIAKLNKLLRKYGVQVINIEGKVSDTYVVLPLNAIIGGKRDTGTKEVGKQGNDCP